MRGHCCAIRAQIEIVVADAALMPDTLISLATWETEQVKA